MTKYAQSLEVSKLDSFIRGFATSFIKSTDKLNVTLGMLDQVYLTYINEKGEKVAFVTASNTNCYVTNEKTNNHYDITNRYIAKMLKWFIDDPSYAEMLVRFYGTGSVRYGNKNEFVALLKPLASDPRYSEMIVGLLAKKQKAIEEEYNKELEKLNSKYDDLFAKNEKMQREILFGCTLDELAEQAEAEEKIKEKANTTNQSQPE